MSYWVYLKDKDGNMLQVPSHSEGGTRVMGGTTEAELNVTVNYYAQFVKVNLDFRERDSVGRNGKTAIHGKRAGDLIPQLKDAVKTLGTVRDDNYWSSTPGNAGFALSILLRWAELHPDGVFEVH